MERFSRLTERERDVLAWAAQGKTKWETSVIMGISERTVSFHIENAKRKLDASNLVMAVAIAIQTGALCVMLHAIGLEVYWSPQLFLQEEDL